jgi:hypothetical protein
MGEHHHKQMIYSQTPPAEGWMGYSQLNSTHDCTLHMTVRTRQSAPYVTTEICVIEFFE